MIIIARPPANNNDHNKDIDDKEQVDKIILMITMINNDNYDDKSN